MPHHYFESFLFFLLAAVVCVPLFRGFKLGAILGYLFAGVLIGPQVFDLVGDVKGVLHFSEIGVVLLLFIIGLELNPEKLWSMRRHIGYLGGSQLVLSAFVITLVILLTAGQSWQAALLLGLALALSSTAFAVQLMAEKGIMASADGRRGLSILLMQDLAVIPILFLVQVLSGGSIDDGQPWWYGFIAIVSVLIIGRFFLDPLLNLVARYGNRETMTATALLIVVGAAYTMYLAGLSMGMGAFMAGILLANSHFRHQLETDIEPFKGLTLGLFFIAIGMTLNVRLLLEQPLFILFLALALILSKALVITGLLAFFRVPWRSGLPFSVLLSQGGEFAFVILSQAENIQLVSPDLVGLVNLVVGLSMAMTAPLYYVMSLLFAKKSELEEQRQDYDQTHENAEILILGFGRFAQMTGRILAANHIPFTALDNNLKNIHFVERFGNKIHFGDVTRLDVLQAAGIDHANTVLLAIENAEKSVSVARLLRQHYPDITIIARAYNRVSYLKLLEAGADKVIREIFAGSLEAASESLVSLGFTTGQALKAVEIFRRHDEELLEKALDHHDDLDKVIEIGLQGRKELEALFVKDKGSIKD